MQTFDGFIAEWLTDPPRRVADPLLVGHGETTATMYQCVSLVKQYWTECAGIVVNWPGNAIDIWNNTDATILTKFSKVGGSAALKGDIVILTPNHIGIATGNINANDVEILEQNGATGGGTGTGGDAIRTRYVARARVAGLLRLIPEPTGPPYTWYAIAPKQVRLNKDTHFWNVDLPTFDEMTANPIAPADSGALVTVSVRLDHVNGYSYYLRSTDDHAGLNTADCDDYTPPPAQPPAAPLPIPTSTDPYEIVKSILGFSTSTDAANHTNAKSSVPAGTYYIFNRRYATDDPSNLLALNVTNVPGIPGSWINPGDNVPDPKPVITTNSQWVGPRDAPVTTLSEPSTPVVAVNPNAWKTTNSVLRQDRKAVLYISQNTVDMDIYDLSSGRKLEQPLKPRTPIHIVSVFVKDGVSYGRPYKVAQRALWYGIPMTILKQQPQKPVNFIDNFQATTTKIVDDAIQWLDDIIPHWYKKDK